VVSRIDVLRAAGLPCTIDGIYLGLDEPTQAIRDTRFNAQAWTRDTRWAQTEAAATLNPYMRQHLLEEAARYGERALEAWRRYRALAAAYRRLFEKHGELARCESPPIETTGFARSRRTRRVA
jgi:hypothetical protein